MKRLPASLIFASGALLLAIGCQTYSSKTPEVIDFQEHIRPILENRCLECHNPVNAADNANLNLESRESALTTGDHAPVILPGNGRQSVLYRVLAVENTHPLFMPPSPDRLWEYQLGLVRKWIDQGAPWPAGSPGKLVRPQDWETPE